VAALDAGSSRELPELLAAADAALYRAKASGRDQVQMISTSRGLSAVRPGGDHDGNSGAIWRGGLRPQAAGLPGAALPAGLPGHAGLPATALPEHTGLPGLGLSAHTGLSAGGGFCGNPVRARGGAGGRQLPGDADGSASTATTSALAV
jgi:hypothetical protein